MIESVETLNDILEPYAGQIVSCEQDGKVYRWDPIEGWKLFQFDGGITMSAYDINKQIIGQLKNLDKETLQEKEKLIREFCNQTKNTYYMLLCRDINYFTLFHLDLKIADETIEEAVIDCLKHIGNVKAIDLTEDGNAIELWVKNHDEVYAAYFFPYDLGVCICG